jgi:uncharacterized coiled-coil protein SlyX
MKTIISSVLITFALVCFALVQNTQAVIPQPDGGYPGGNTAEGTKALLSQTTGGYNAAIGWLSLESLTTGSFNTGVGAGTLALNNGDENTATGAGALLFHATGNANTANGAFALFSDTSGQANTATGAQALFNNTTGGFNTATGFSALFSNTTGGGNTAIGPTALNNNIDGINNTAVGISALAANTSGSNNVALGLLAGAQQTTGSNNVYIGAQIEGTAGESDACYIASIFNQTSSSGIPVLINSNNKLGTTTSSKRFKEEIKPMAKTSEMILALKPVTFRYKKEIDPAGTSQFGLVAEEVEKVNPDLVVRDKEGKPYSVRYDQVNAMLLNEFLKEHRKVDAQDRRLGGQEATIAELKSIITQQQKAMEAVTAQLKEQAAQIQKVSAQTEISRSTAQVVVTNH